TRPSLLVSNVDVVAHARSSPQKKKPRLNKSDWPRKNNEPIAQASVVDLQEQAGNRLLLPVLQPLPPSQQPLSNAPKARPPPCRIQMLNVHISV
ncbi:hypothetical protein BGZ94_000370, partial [Podila epigama]